MLAAPPLILAAMDATFRGLAGRFGARTGYLCGFSVYWLGWCFAFPLALLGRDGFRSLFRDARPRLGRPAWLGLLALVLPPALGGVAAFPKAIRQASPRVVLLSAGIAAVNAVGEEVLWRGAFLRWFPGRLLLGYVYPAAGFALWHYAPQTVFANRRPGGAHSFVASAGLFGLLYRWLAWRTGTIRWTTVSHTLLDFSGLGARLYLR